MGLVDSVKKQVEGRKSSMKKWLEKGGGPMIRDIRDEFFEISPIWQGNKSQVEEDIREATKALDKKYEHKFSPQVTAILWIEQIEGKPRGVSPILDIAGVSFNDLHKIDQKGDTWDDVNRIRNMFNARAFLRHMNTYSVTIQIIEDFNLKQLEYNDNLDADDIEALALFMELPEFAAKFAEEGTKDRKKDAQKIEEKLDNRVQKREQEAKKMLGRTKESRSKAEQKFGEGLLKLAQKRGTASESEVKKAMEEFEQDISDWSVDQPFSHDKFKELVGERY